MLVTDLGRHKPSMSTPTRPCAHLVGSSQCRGGHCRGLAEISAVEIQN